MEIRLCWYQKSNRFKWNYVLIDHMIVNLDVVIPLTFVLGSHYYELHLIDKIIFHNFLLKKMKVGF